MKKLLLAVVVSSCSLLLHAQDEPSSGKGFQKDKLFAGGNFGLTFGDYTLINFSPQVGYRFNRFLSAGLGINGQYENIKDYDIVTGSLYSKEKRAILGLNMFGRFYPIRNLMLQVQPEGNYIFGNITFYDTNPKQSFKLDAQIVPSLLMGGGLVFPAGRGETIISLFYDVLQSPNTPYGNRPIFNIGYNMGF